MNDLYIHSSTEITDAYKNINAVSERKRTWKDKLRWKLFSISHIQHRKPDSFYKDFMHTNAIISLSFTNRIRVLLSGRIHYQVRVLTENIVGECSTNSCVHILPPTFLERKD